MTHLHQNTGCRVWVKRDESVCLICAINGETTFPLPFFPLYHHLAFSPRPGFRAELTATPCPLLARQPGQAPLSGWPMARRDPSLLSGPVAWQESTWHVPGVPPLRWRNQDWRHEIPAWPTWWDAPMCAAASPQGWEHHLVHSVPGARGISEAIETEVMSQCWWSAQHSLQYKRWRPDALEASTLLVSLVPTQ